MAAPHSSQSLVVSLQKAALRREMLVRRAAQDPAVGAVLAGHILRDLAIPPAAAIAGVWPFGDEIDLRPLWHELHARGYAVLLPQTPGRGQPLIFRRWEPAFTMIGERFGTQCPDGLVAAPDLIFVPLLAFDHAGNRLGYGGGYYDRTLAAHPGVPAVGFGYAAQQVPVVPAEPHDHRLPAIFTERGGVALEV